MQLPDGLAKHLREQLEDLYENLKKQVDQLEVGRGGRIE